MKIRCFFNIFLFTILFGVDINAITVSKDEALQKALLFLSCMDKNATIDKYSPFGKADMYKVVSNKGWVLLSSEKCVKPILAYSCIDTFPELNDMPEGMKWLFSYYEDIIAYAKHHASELSMANAWRDDMGLLYNNREIYCLSQLGDVKWGQSANNSNDGLCDKIYNKFCPTFHSVSCNRTIVGCGAVALGQILWYYQWPYWGLIYKNMLNDEGVVSNEMEYKFYDWNLMPSEIISETPDVEAAEIASLLRDCGYAEHMRYGSNESYTYVDNIKDALISSYGYTTVQKQNRTSFSGNWVELMKNEIRNGRPVIYRGGNSNGGHFFILYGFSGDYFNINWGWRGQYNSTMCSLDALNVAGTNYNTGHYALINIYPIYPICIPMIDFPLHEWDTNFLIQNGGGITIGDRIISSGMQGGIISGAFVKLTSGFKVNMGAEVYIDVKNMHCDDDRITIEIMDKNEESYMVQTKSLIDTMQATKILRNSQLLILRDGKTYTVTGAEVK